MAVPARQGENQLLDTPVREHERTYEATIGDVTFPVRLRYTPDEAHALHPLCDAALAEAQHRAARLATRRGLIDPAPVPESIEVRLTRERIVDAVDRDGNPIRRGRR